MPATWIILVNWNGGADTVECLESLLRLNDPDYAVAVVDNGSSDDSVARIEAWGAGRAPIGPIEGPWAKLPPERARDASLVTIDAAPGVPPPPTTARATLLLAGANLGFAAASNLGMRFAARDPEARFYWILNNDTIVAPDSLSRQRARMAADETVGMLGARLMFYHRPEAVQGLAGRFLRWRGRSEHIGLDLSPDRLPSRDDVERGMSYVLGASMFVRKEVADRIGGMSERYFLYFEELDWARRLPRPWRLGAELDAVVWHKEGGSIGSATRGRPSDTSLYYLAANLLRFYARFERPLLPLALARLLRDAAGYRKQGDSGAARAIFRAIGDALRGRRRRGRYGSAEFEGPIPATRA